MSPPNAKTRTRCRRSNTLIAGSTTSHSFDSDRHCSLIARAHRRYLLDLLAPGRRHRRSTCRPRQLRKWCRRQETLLEDGWASAVEVQVVERRREQRRAAVARDHRMGGDLKGRLPRQENRGLTRSQNLRHLAQSVIMLADSEDMLKSFADLVTHGESPVVGSRSPHVGNETDVCQVDQVQPSI